MDWDVFISHASEDKSDVVDELVEKLQAAGLRVWYDKTALVLGDSLRRKIDEGLAQSKFGVVVLSQKFFAKKWPQAELDGLFALEKATAKKILPVWHKIDHDSVSQFAPTLAERVAAKTSDGIDAVVEKIRIAVAKGETPVTAIPAVFPSLPADKAAKLATFAPGIGAEALAIVKEAGRTNARIFEAQTDQAYIVRVGAKRFGDDTHPSQAKYKEAIRQLVMSKFVDQFGSLFDLNTRGFELYDLIK